MASGEFESHDENGNIVYSGNFENGIYNGSGSLYINGILFYTGDFVMGNRTGQGKEFDSNGHLIYEGGFLCGLYDGNGTLFDRETGYVVFSGNFRDGKALELPTETIPVINETVTVIANN